MVFEFNFIVNIFFADLTIYFQLIVEMEEDGQLLLCHHLVMGLLLEVLMFQYVFTYKNYIVVEQFFKAIILISSLSVPVKNVYTSFQICQPQMSYTCSPNIFHLMIVLIALKKITLSTVNLISIDRVQEA